MNKVSTGVYNEMLPCLQFNYETYAIQTKAGKTNHMWTVNGVECEHQGNAMSTESVNKWMNGDGVCYFVINR